MIAHDTGIGVIEYWRLYREQNSLYLFQRPYRVDYRPICVISDRYSNTLLIIKEKNLLHLALF